MIMLHAVLISAICSMSLPEGGTPEPLNFAHFPDRLHAYVWRNWTLVPQERLAQVVGASPEDVLRLGKAMGLPDPPPVDEAQMSRTYITIIRANWHLLPYEQLQALLGWTEDKLAYTLREDDFLFIKLGRVKPACKPLTWAPPDAAAIARQAEIAAAVHAHFGDAAGQWVDPPLSFIDRLSAPLEPAPEPPAPSLFNPRFCYSYFALYGDPLLEHDPFPEGYLQRLSQAGVNGVWLHAVLYKLSPFPWEASLSDHWQERLTALRSLTERAAKHGMGVYLYLNEPRTMPLSFFEAHPELRGVVEHDAATLCTSLPEVREYLSGSVRRICEAAPDLAGFFTISASENLTNCWSHGGGGACPRCAGRGPAEVIAELHGALNEGIRQANSKARLIAWDWGWGEDWAPNAIALLPDGVSLMSVSEWHTPIERGGIESAVGEYSISAIGPGPRARRHWAAAQERSLPTLAKIQANNTWELSALPFIPAAVNVAKHATALRDTGVSGLMLGWTLGGWPSPNLEIVYELGKRDANGAFLSPDEALLRVAKRRCGDGAAAAVVAAWRVMSDAFSEFPYHVGVVYSAPLQVGPANLLWPTATGYAATMVGIPYDHLDAWRAIYPTEVFVRQLNKAADGFEAGAAQLRAALDATEGAQRITLSEDGNLAEAAAVHFRSVANQAAFTDLRNTRAAGEGNEEGAAALIALVEQELALAKRLHALQTQDSRIGFEATNHYFYTPMDLAEKALNCIQLLELMKER